MDPFALAGRVALVTGSTRGLGRAMANALGRAGAKVAFNYYNDEGTADRALNEFVAEGLEGILVRGDITDPADVERVVGEIGERLGPVDILVPNATCAQPMELIEDYDWETYQRMIDFFVKSPFLLTRACLPHMKQQGWGRIINICTTAFVAGKPVFSAYVAAKGGQVGMSRSLASELAPFGITVNMVSPGWIPVERHADEPQAAKDAYRDRIPTGRLGVPDDVGGAVVFLASEAASFVTGQNINVNGGVTIG
ncbi:MAG: 3-oxoacyl-ACP reductase family protein [Planctomycetota bacterium]|nr:3-oxoacyl-ACP reductase family protein [Planctomycetota bacterium]